MSSGYKSPSVESSTYVPTHNHIWGFLRFTEDVGKVIVPFMTGITLVHPVAGNNKYTGPPAKKAISRGSRILVATAKDAVVPQGTTDSGMVGGRFAAT